MVSEGDVRLDREPDAEVDALISVLARGRSSLVAIVSALLQEAVAALSDLLLDRL